MRVVNHTLPEYATSLGEFLALTKATALLMRGTEGEPVADARRCPRLAALLDGDEQPALESRELRNRDVGRLCERRHWIRLRSADGSSVSVA